jgi:death-on-curing family protein
MSEIVIYQTTDNQAQVEVRFKNETVWLSQKMMADLFNKDSDTIGLHLKKIYAEGELDEKATTELSSVVQAEGSRKVTRRIRFYNLDAILSVGYRVNSKRGTQFRQWATARLKDYLVEGYAINQKRLAEKNLELKRLKDGIGILHRAIENEARSLADAGSLASLLDRFAAGLSLLDDYDHKTLDAKGKTERVAVQIGADEYRALVRGMDASFGSSIFGMEKDQGFDSAVRQIYQTFNGKDLYPTLEDKAATLFYLVVKNHAFVDGNKRIAAACFLYFLERNGMLTLSDGRNLIDNDTIAALTLFVAVSKSDEMETVKNVVISILNRKEAT